MPTWSSSRLVVESDDHEEPQDEPLGSKEKFWIQDVASRERHLVKFARGTNEDVRGEDWAEWIVQHMADALSVPHAQVVPITLNGRRGIASKSVLRFDTAQRLVHGNELLSEADIDYDSSLERENPGYTVRAVRHALREVDQPISFTGPRDMDAFDVWAGYVTLDAWVAGRDRHHENWAIISERDRRTLSPSYDHGNALGFQESDANRQRCADDPQRLKKWASRGRSHHFAGKPILVDVAHEALSLASPVARAYWSSQLTSIEWADIDGVVSAVPRALMSEAAANFAMALLRVNMRRLLDAYPAF